MCCDLALLIFKVMGVTELQRKKSATKKITTKIKMIFISVAQ